MRRPFQRSTEMAEQHSRSIEPVEDQLERRETAPKRGA